MKKDTRRKSSFLVTLRSSNCGETKRPHSKHNKLTITVIQTSVVRASPYFGSDSRVLQKNNGTRQVVTRCLSSVKLRTYVQHVTHVCDDDSIAAHACTQRVMALMSAEQFRPDPPPNLYPAELSSIFNLQASSVRLAIRNDSVNAITPAI